MRIVTPTEIRNLGLVAFDAGSENREEAKRDFGEVENPAISTGTRIRRQCLSGGAFSWL
jgi:hypothetical protein